MASNIINWPSFEDFLPVLPPLEQAMAAHLHELALAAAPEMRCKFSYGAPFYRRRSNVCFIWPGSLTWMGGGHRPGEVAFGLVRGHLLSDADGLFRSDGRKQVTQAVFKSLKDMPDAAIVEVLAEAVLLDEAVFIEKSALKSLKDRLR